MTIKEIHALDLHSLLKRMRDAGWMVAVHNDYHVDGRFYTFWLFTHSLGNFVKGEDRTDRLAVARCVFQAQGVEKAHRNG